jgi:hypothetical protein
LSHPKSVSSAPVSQLLSAEKSAERLPNACTTSGSSAIAARGTPSTSLATSPITNDRIRVSAIAASILVHVSPTPEIVLNGISSWVDC